VSINQWGCLTHQASCVRSCTYLPSGLESQIVRIWSAVRLICPRNAENTVCQPVISCDMQSYSRWFIYLFSLSDTPRIFQRARMPSSCTCTFAIRGQGYMPIPPYLSHFQRSSTLIYQTHFSLIMVTQMLTPRSAWWPRSHFGTCDTVGPQVSISLVGSRLLSYIQSVQLCMWVCL